VIVKETRLAGVYLVDPERNWDERGYFARVFCEREFAHFNLASRFVQCNVSFNARKGTLRGMHYQAEPRGECKLVRCTRGAIYDVIIDLRRESPTFCEWAGFTLDEQNGQALYIPTGFAHGFQTLTESSEVFYQMSEFYDPELARGVRWNDPRFAIEWCLPQPLMSARDASYPDFLVGRL